MAQAYGLGALLYSPLAGGLLTGKYRCGGQGRLSPSGQPERDAQQTAVVDAVLQVASESGATPVQVSLCWLRHRAGASPTPLLPILGPGKVTHLQEYLGSLDVELDAKQYERLSTVSAVKLGTPHDAVTAALDHGFDGNRETLQLPTVPVI